MKVIQTKPGYEINFASKGDCALLFNSRGKPALCFAVNQDNRAIFWSDEIRNFLNEKLVGKWLKQSLFLRVSKAKLIEGGALRIETAEGEKISFESGFIIKIIKSKDDGKKEITETVWVAKTEA